LTLDDDDVEQGVNLLYGIEIPEQSSGSELFFFFSEQQSKQNSNENETK
jgi:hypothetical protein